jgi:hypothetical protein
MSLLLLFTTHTHTHTHTLSLSLSLSPAQAHTNTHTLPRVYNGCLFFLYRLLPLETTSESGISDLETSMNDLRCTCCPYGYHLDTDFMKFLDDMYGPHVLRTLKSIERKRHDLRHRLMHEQTVIIFTVWKRRIDECGIVSEKERERERK